MMGVSRVGLLLLLSALALAQQSNDNEPTSACQLVSRFKAFRKYLYLYTTESRNGVAGTTSLRNGPKVTCKVEIEVPQACSFVMHTTDCAVSEVSLMDPQGQPVYSPAAGSDAFHAAMEKNPLKFTVENAMNVVLYSLPDDPVNILNIKRGIVSALLSPNAEESRSIMSTVHGHCQTAHQVKDTTDLSVTRDLSQCNQFYGRELTSSPLALLMNLHYPFSKLITSKQECNYQFDNKGKHITAVSCTEKHVFLPFSHKGNGMSSLVTQELNFQNSKRINNRVFDLADTQIQPLHFSDPDDKAPVQTQEAAVNILSELLALPGTDQGQQRASLFHKLITTMRALRNETLSETVTSMLDLSTWVTWQSLFQCGTPECTSAILQSIWKIDGVAAEVDALVYTLGLRKNPTAAQLRDMLSTAQYKQSKAIMYALAHTVKNFYRGDITLEIRDVAAFMEEMLNECSGELGPNMDPEVIRNPQELSYLVLRVIGVMGQPMQDYGPSLASAVLRCAKKADAPLSTQKAAIQAFRNININDEVRSALMEIYQDGQSQGEKRVAAYLILINNMDEATAKAIVDSVEDITDKELKTFVVTHLNNVLKSDLHATYYIQIAVGNKELPSLEELSGKSSSFMTEISGASVKSNFIFDDANTLPKDVSLDVSLDKDYRNKKLFKLNFEGEGFEPAFEALLGTNGFVPDAFFKLSNWGLDKAQTLKDLLSSSNADDSRRKRQVPDDLVKGVADGFQKLIADLRSSQTPEAVMYMELLGSEIGYMKISQIRDILETLSMYQHVFLRMLPAAAISKLTDSTENEVFAHYIFMENGFSLPTASGLPLKFSFAGVLAPGAKGGLTFSGNMGALSFMPSVGVEFITNMGVYVPDYVNCGLEMHTNMFHESSLNAKVTWDRNQFKLAVPAPTTNTQLFSVSTEVLSVCAGQTNIVPSLNEDRTDLTECQPLITGLNLCTVARYSNGSSIDDAPYYPLTGESRFAVEIQPTGEVSEYSVSLTRKMHKDGKDRVTVVKLSLKAEGVDSEDITASLKYNHMKNTMYTELNIPDYDIEAGIKLALLDNHPRSPGTRGITIDVSNKNIPQLSLSARTRLEMMKEALLQLQMTLPSFNTDSSITMTLNNDDILTMTLETALNLPETLYQQKVSLRYDDDKVELELKTDANSEIQKLIPNAEDHHRQLQQLLDDMLDQRVPKTDMKLRHIVTKGIKAVNIWMDKLTAQFPYLENLRNKRSISELTLPPLPEKLFFQYDGLFRYQFNKDWLPVALPLPLGGKTSQELDFPEEFTYPEINLPKISLRIPPLNVKLPPFTIPPTLDFSLPLLGLAEASAKINSNFYSWEGSISGGNNTIDVPNYIAHYKIMAQSPFCVLSYKLEGTGMVTGKVDNSLKYVLSNTFNHCLIDSSFSAVETVQVTDKLNAKADYKIEISSPLGFDTTWFYTAQATSTPEQEVSGDGALDGKLKIGSHNCEMSYTQSYTAHALDREGRGESSFVFKCPQIELQNIIQGVYKNSELSIISKTNALDDALKHVAELKFKDKQLTLKCNGMATGMGKMLNNKVEIGMSDQMALFKVESQIDDAQNRLYSLLTGDLDFNGLEVNSEGSLTFDLGRGLHKASLSIGKNGLAATGTNTIQCTPVTIENLFNGAIGRNGAMFSNKIKAMGDEGRGELNFDGQVTSSEATLQGFLKARAFEGTTRNNMNVLINSKGLTFTADTVGSMKQIKMENSHQLTATLWTLNLRSKSNNFICEDVYYKQDAKVNMQPFVTKIDMSNDLRLYDLGLNNEGHLKLQPTNLELNGVVMAALGTDNIAKHTYDINFSGLEGAVKYSTSAETIFTKLSHSCDFEFAGLSSTTKCEAMVNSKSLRLDSVLKIMALPFSLSIDGIVNGDGEISIPGKLSGQLYSRFLFKGEPLSMAFTHEKRLATTHKPRFSEETTTNFDSKLEGLVMPQNQFLNWKLKTKLNNHAYNQDFSVYNNPMNIGAEFSGVAVTDILSKLTKDSRNEEELSISGFLKYDKNEDCHIIQLPFIESLPAAFERVRATLVQALESLYKFIDSLDINTMIANFKTQLGEMPKKVGDFMREFDLPSKVAVVKDKMEYLLKEFSVTFEDFEKAMTNLKIDLEETIMDISAKINDLLGALKDYVESGELANKITNVMRDIGEYLWNLNEKYEIQLSLRQLLGAIEDILRQIDLQKLTETSTAWLKDLDAQYGIMDKLKDWFSEIKQAVENFDIKKFFEDIKDSILSFDLPMYIEKLQYTIPSSDMKRVIENMKDVIVNWIDEYEIPQKINAVYTFIKDQILKYNLDEKFRDLMDQFVSLIEDFKIEETLQTIVDTIKNINFEYAYNVIIEALQNLNNALKNIDYKKLIDDLNDNLARFVTNLKELDYHMFVDQANEKFQELADYINEQIKVYKIVEKIEAVREFLREIQNSVYAYLDGLKNTKVADVLTKWKNVIDATFLNDVKLKALDVLEDIRQRISDMDVIDEITVYLQRASEFYTNTVELISMKLLEYIEIIAKQFKDNNVLEKIKTAIEEAIKAIKVAEIKMPMFTVPFTDLTIPELSFNLNNLPDISIPPQITIPEITILNTYKIPGFTIDFEDLKAKIIAFIDDLKMFKIEWPDPHDIFGDVKVLYLFDLPDLTFPEISLSEVKVPAITVPKLNLEAFEITMLPIPPMKLPEIPSDFCIPVFGKLYGEFRLNSPQYNLMTTGKIENATSTLKNPLFITSLNSQATSVFKPLEFNLEVDARLEAPRMKKMLFSETVKATHMAFSVNHEGTLSLTSSSAEATARTNTKASTPIYTADLMNNIVLTLKDGITATCDTTYDHNIDLPSVELISQCNAKHTGTTTLQSGKVSVNGETNGNCKWTIGDYSDEGTHKNKLDFTLDLRTAKLTYDADTDSKCFKSKESLMVDSVILDHTTAAFRCEMDIPSLKKSATAIDVQANAGELKLAVTASHNCDYTGDVMGTEESTLDFKVQPYEMILDGKNKANLKISLPLKLTGKVDFQNDYCLILNSEKQKACWLALIRFNQYKYTHNCVVENNGKETYLHKMMNAEANLDFLTVPLSIPEMQIPYFEKSTPAVTDFSLWDNAGLKYLLHSPQQSFDLNLKLHYFKNSDTHIYDLNLEPFYNAISDNANAFREQFEMLRDKVVDLLKESQSQVRKRYIKHKKDSSSIPPKIITIPGYKIPILNIEVSSFTAELPAFSYVVPKEVSTPSFKVPALGFSVPSYILVLPSIELPMIQVPETIGNLQLPTFTLPEMQNSVVIPAMGNLTLDFSYKSAVVTVSANGGVFNQSDIVARFTALSSSVLEVLNGKLDGTTSLTSKNGIKLANTFTLEHQNVQGNHECAISLSKRGIGASFVNYVKISMPFLNLEFDQAIEGNSQTTPTATGKNKLKYMFNIPVIDSTGKGTLDISSELEAFSSYISLDTVTQGKSDISIMDKWSVAQDLNNKATFFLSANGLRITLTTSANSNVDTQEQLKRSTGDNLIHFDMVENFALEISLRRMFAALDCTSNNKVISEHFDTNGMHTVTAEFDLAPFKSFKTKVNIDLKQPSSLGHIGFIRNIDLVIVSAKQSISWEGKEQFASFVHSCNFAITNEETEVRMDFSESMEGHLAFLKSMKVPVYQRTLWDVLKLDQVTSMDDLQVLSISSSVVYTKSAEGQEYAIPFKLFEEGVLFKIPGVTIAVPHFIRKIPGAIRKIDMRFEEVEIPDFITIPPALSVPEFELPFTNLFIEAFTVDLKQLAIPKKIVTKEFDIMLPGLPVLSVPSYEISTEYLQKKMSYLSIKIAQYEIQVSSFTLPKSISIGEMSFDLDEIKTYISNFELPTIVIPEQRIEIPEVDLLLPSSIYIPSFGALSATFKVASPIYNVSTTVNVEKRDSDLMTALNSNCFSTMGFLEYELTATATFGLGDMVSLKGNINFAHSDISLKWQHTFTRAPRMKREAPSPDPHLSSHTLTIDITSPLFSDVGLRFAARKDGITASMSSPTTGFLGLTLQRRSPTQLFGKLFIRYLSTPEKDTDIITFKATLKNSQKLTLHSSFNLDTLRDVMEESKGKIPAVTEAIVKVINKYHTAHFGFDINRGGMKLKNTVSNAVERAYHEFPLSLHELQSLVEKLIDKALDVYWRASDELMNFNINDAVNKLDQLQKRMWEKVSEVNGDFRQYLDSLKLTVPGSDEQISVLEIMHKLKDRVVQMCSRLLELMSEITDKVEFTLPGTDIFVSLKEILRDLENSLKKWAEELQRAERDWSDKFEEWVGQFSEGQDFIDYLNNENKKIGPKFEELLVKLKQLSKEQTGKASDLIVELKDSTKELIQDIYISINIDNINNGANDVIDFLQMRLHSGLKNSIDSLSKASERTVPYLKITGKRVEVDISLPFLWKSFSEWPTLPRQWLEATDSM